MNNTLTLYEETLTGERTHFQTLDFLTSRITVRQLIRAYVHEQVHEAQIAANQVATERVQPTPAERELNPDKVYERNLQQPRHVNWEQEAERALEAFTRNRYFILIGDRQAESLDEQIELRVGTEVTFLKLIPLAGG